MGGKNDAILRYLEDNARFADLMNGAVFGGVQAVDPKQLEDASEHYTEKEGKAPEYGPAVPRLYRMSVPRDRTLGRAAVSERYDAL